MALNCKRCNKPIRKPGPNKYFCTECMEWRRRRGIYSYKRECPVCGNTFYTNYRVQDTCGDPTCKRRYRKTIQLARLYQTPEQNRKEKERRERRRGIPGDYAIENGSRVNAQIRRARKCQFVVSAEGEICGKPVAPGNRFLCRQHFEMAGNYDSMSEVA